MSDDPAKSRFSGDLPDRVHRLLACALCRCAGPLLDAPLLDAVGVAEAFADRRATADELRRAAAGARGFVTSCPDEDRMRLAFAVVTTASSAEPSVWNGRRTMHPFAAGTVSEFVCHVLGFRPPPGERYCVELYPPLFDDVMRRPITLSPAWRTGTAVALARQVYESRDFGAMPILADALQDAGCDSEDILSHCRSEGPHVRGCWVVDLVLGKE